MAILATALLANAAQSPASADTTVAASQTQTGGTLAVSPPVLLVTDADNPLLTLTDGAVTAGVEALIVGNLNGESGLVLVENGSQLASVGDGSLIAPYGAAPVFTGNGYVGLNAGSTGAVVVKGDESKWTTSGELIVGYLGVGTLSIEEGASVSNAFAEIGAYADSHGAVTVAGDESNWNVAGELVVGFLGAASLAIEDGGKVMNTYGWIGGIDGEATVEGEGSAWNNSDELYVGYNGAAKLTVADGGRVTASTLYVSLSELFGDGEISTQGAVVDDYVLTFDATHGLVQTIPFGTGGQWNLDVDGSGAIGAGYNGAGSLVVADGAALATSAGYVGFNDTAQGEASVSGDGSSWTVAEEFVVGFFGAGSLRIENGGAVNNGVGVLGANVGAQGTATVSGNNSTWTNDDALYVGNLGAATLTIELGGAVESAVGYLGALAGSHGEATVSGDDSTWTNDGSLFIGDEGTGKLIVENGGAVSDSFAEIAVAAGSQGEATVAGDRSIWSHVGLLRIGFGGKGKLVVADGGAVTNTVAYLGFASDAEGEAIVRGEGSSWTNSGSIRVGYAGKGTLEIADGAVVSSAAGFVGYSGDAQGQATIRGEGSIWINSGNLIVAGFSLGNSGGSGDVTIADGGTARVGGTLKLHANGTLNLQSGGRIETRNFDFADGAFNFTGGTLAVSGDVTGYLVVPDGGAISPGAGVGAMNVDSGQWQSGGGLLWEINALANNGGAAGGEIGWDLADYSAALAISATAANPFVIDVHSFNVDGAADLLTGFDPEQSYAWTFASAGAITGFNPNAFSISTDGFADGLFGGQFSVAKTGNELQLVFTPNPNPLPGDATGDQLVNRRDLVRFFRHYGLATSAALPQGDFNDDDLVNLVDLAILQANLSPNITPSPAAVPEPSALMLAIVGAALFVARRGRGNGRPVR